MVEGLAVFLPAETLLPASIIQPYLLRREIRDPSLFTVINSKQTRVQHRGSAHTLKQRVAGQLYVLFVRKSIIKTIRSMGQFLAV